MVSYQTWTSIMFDVAESRGAEIDTIRDGAMVVELSAEIWDERKDELSTSTREEAQDVARQEVMVK